MITKNIKQKLLDFFFDNPTTRLRLRHIEKETGFPFPSVSRYVKELVSEGYLLVEEVSGIILYFANKSDERFIFEKKLHNLQKIFDSGLIKFLKFEISLSPVIIFGSYCRGEDNENSDIDLFIEYPGKLNIDLSKYEKIFNKKIQVFSEKSISEIPNPHLVNSIMNGISIVGQVEILK